MPLVKSAWFLGTEQPKAPDTVGSSPTGISVGELAAHTHPINSYTATGGTVSALIDHENAAAYGWKTNMIEKTGGNEYHNNVSPAISAYLWKRTA